MSGAAPTSGFERKVSQRKRELVRNEISWQANLDLTDWIFGKSGGAQKMFKALATGGERAATWPPS